ncbi:MAG: acyl carrier protein [Proteobacteria bacterium]|nr:acyl carrier protein [Pseudomonadota bacterium]
MSIRSAVLDQVKLVAEQQRKTLAPLTDDLPLVGSGLDSLCIALVVANLEDELGVDPFGVMGSVEMPVTLGEFIHFYEAAPAAKD